MANEIRGVAGSGLAPKARILNKAGLWWNGSTFEAFASANYATYLVGMTEQGVSGVYMADFPALITTAGTYEYYVQLGSVEGDPVLNTGKVDWTGSAAVTSASGAMSGSDFRDYILRVGFVRDDKDTEVYEAITDAIQRMRRLFAFDEAEVDDTTTDTISVLGDYKLDIESDMGMLSGVIVEDGTNASELTKISKSDFDEMYPYAAVDTGFRGYPRVYTVYAGQIYIGPTPDLTSFTYRLNYSKRAGAITSSTAGVPFTNLYRDILADLTLALLYKGLEEYDKATIHMQEYASQVQLAIRKERVNSGQSCFVQEYRDC